MRSISTSKLNTPITTTSTPSSIHSAWHSPIPYLFGGLAAIMCLITFALLMLACSYWRLYGNQHGDQRDLENKEGDPENKEPIKVHEEKILVIMAGDENPTFLATPTCSKSSSFVHDVGNNFDQHLGNRDKHLVLVPAADTTTQQENNRDSQQEQHSRQ
ncbi:protein GLUTAMINE DUMPER 5-like [Gastrolobium bilobum]|uniref:protein GLUTAMINE DUMPER 5-like n=1 Tax=Gastrolobium bilobum TaxID=150636 RepID=UPI002AB2CE5F|nr:protein GLUTAMINE DUMPER 5-like [Gastrolobium bilobum]